MKVLSVIALLFAIVAACHPTFALRQGEGRGVGVSIKGEEGQLIRLYEKSYALVIGVSDYSAGWPDLPGVRKDVEAVSRALEAQGFQVVKVENPDSAQLDKSFREFIDAYGQGPQNRLLFYFAGHGHTLKSSYGEEMGYVVPSDAPLPGDDPAGFRSRALNLKQVERYAEDVQSKHALFVFDSCFSGSVLGLSRSRAVPAPIGYKTGQPVRQFIASGSADERVPDESVFRRQFVAALEGEADLNRDGYVTGTELGEYLQDKVITYTRNTQHPQYGKIRNEFLDKGDFVFQLAKASPRPAVVASTPAPEPSAAEVSFWNSIQNSTDPEDYKLYLDKYPNGLFAALAKKRAQASRPNTDAAASPGAVSPTTGNGNATPLTSPSLGEARPRPCTEMGSKTALYNKFKENFKGPAEQQRLAYESGKEYLSVYGNCPDASDQQVVRYIQNWVGKYVEASYAYNCTKAANETPATAFDACRQWSDAKPEDLKPHLTLVFVGIKTYTNGDKSLNARAAAEARTALRLIEAGKTTDAWAPFSSQQDAAAGLRYYIAAWTYDSNPAEAVDQLLQVVQSNSAFAKEPATYQLLGAAVYNGDVKKMAAEYKTKCEGKEATNECDVLLDKVNRGLDRVIDAYARSVALANANPSKYGPTLTQVRPFLTTLYKQRHEGLEAGLDELISGVLSRPLP